MQFDGEKDSSTYLRASANDFQPLNDGSPCCVWPHIPVGLRFQDVLQDVGDGVNGSRLCARVSSQMAVLWTVFTRAGWTVAGSPRGVLSQSFLLVCMLYASGSGSPFTIPALLMHSVDVVWLSVLDFPFTIVSS